MCGAGVRVRGRGAVADGPVESGAAADVGGDLVGGERLPAAMGQGGGGVVILGCGPRLQNSMDSVLVL